MTYTPTRPIMSADELRAHHVDAHGRNFMVSSDGYDDMELNERLGWHTQASWGRDGWDLGAWPYIVISTRHENGTFDVLSVCEGDHDVYSFSSESDQHAALDYLFLWNTQSASYVALKVDRAELDAGRVTVDDRYRGPYRTESAEVTP